MEPDLLMKEDISQYSSKTHILLKGARLHNLKNIDVVFPRNKFTVITGVSGSGKSTLALDTLYAEGQRRYVESLSSYARQFLGRMSKPEVDYIKGIAPAIAIEQKVNTRNPRSTVGTSTEIYDYLKLLFARVGKTFSPISGKPVKRHTVTDIVDFIFQLPEDTKAMIVAPLKARKGRKTKDQLNLLLQQGFTRILHNNEVLRIDDILESKDDYKLSGIQVVIDRIVVKYDDEFFKTRVADSIQTAFYEGEGKCNVDIFSGKKRSKRHSFSNKYEMDGITFEEPSVNFFSFNNPYGACKTCEGFGSVIGIDEDLVVPDKSLSIYEEAIACWRGEKMSQWKEQLVMNAYKFDFPVHKPYYELSEKQKSLLWTGNEYFDGLNAFFKHLEEKAYKIQYRVMLSRYRGRTVCPDCKGTRLRKDASYVKINDKSIIDLVLMPVDEIADFFTNIELSEHDQQVAKRLLIEIQNRLAYLMDVGLGYLTLNRLSSSLSGGESQRINLATALGSSLIGSMYILDEPSIGLHSKDTNKLIKVLKKLRDIGNTVIVVEHDEEIINAADYIIDIGPLAGSLGGEVIFSGWQKDLVNSTKSLTAKYLTGKESIAIPERRRKWKEYIEIIGARENNLKGFTVKFPLNILAVVTGVSGSGKSSLVKSVFYTALKKIHGGYAGRSGKFDKIEGDIHTIEEVEMVDQNPIGRSSRSNPVSYLKTYDEIRNLYSKQPLAKSRGYKPGFFSFNIPGGRCETCEGAGQVKIEMQFMADIVLPCEDCKGTRFKQEVLDIKYNKKNISDILGLTVDEAIQFFSQTKGNYEKRIVNKLQPLADVGLGYIKLGQPSSTLSGGEAQRVKLAFFLSKGIKENKTLFLFDEPTTGLHFHDIDKLLGSFNALIKNGHSIIVIEHNPEIIKCADWIIDLGPGGGKKGGELIFEGKPCDIVKEKKSFTGEFLKGKIK